MKYFIPAWLAGMFLMAAWAILDIEEARAVECPVTCVNVIVK